MIKFIVAAIWIVGVTVGSIYFAFSAGKAAPATEVKPAAYFGGLDYVKTDVISVPIVHDAAVQGYFLARFVYTAEQKKLAQMSVPAENILIDEVITYLYSHPLIDFTNTVKLDIDAFRNGLRDAINKRVGDDLIQEIMLEQVDYLSKQEIRDNTMKRRSGKKPVNVPGAPSPDAVGEAADNPAH